MIRLLVAFFIYLFLVCNLQAQQLIGNTWVIKRSFVTVGTDTSDLYSRNASNNIFDLSPISILFKTAGVYIGTAVNNSEQGGTWNLNGTVLILDGEPGNYFPINSHEFIVSSSFFILDTLSGEFNIPAVSHLWFTDLITGNQIEINAKIFLQGPYVSASQLMFDSLRIKNLIPLTEPYTGLLNFTHVGGGGEQTDNTVLSTSGANAIVDWVFLELRSAVDPTQILATRSALLQRDGDVVDVDGTSLVNFSLTTLAESYYLAIYHRNHLPILSATALNLTVDMELIVDFTSLQTATYGLNAQRNLNGKMVMWAGDASGNGNIKYNGSSNDRNTILSVVGLTTPNRVVSGYLPTDLNLDGRVKYNGSSNDRNVILSTVGLGTPNLIVVRQLP